MSIAVSLDDLSIFNTKFKEGMERIDSILSTDYNPKPIKNYLDRYKLEKSREERLMNKNKNSRDIISAEKVKTEKEIQNLRAAKKIQDLKSYDIIKGQFIDPQTENEFRKSIEEKQMSTINNAVRDKLKNKNYIIINPINNEVYDKEEQKKIQQKQQKH